MSTLFYEVAFVSLVASSLQQKAKSEFFDTNEPQQQRCQK